MIATWERNSFLGIHTQPAKVEAGDQYPLDLLNMRIDGNGWLQLRAPVEDSRTIGDETTGVATTDTHIFLLSEGGKVKIAKISDFATATLTTALTDEDLTGRLSLVDFGNYVVFTSEGEDQGYIVDIRDDDDYQIFPLGFPAPSSVTAEAIPNNNKLEFGKIYVFRLTHLYAIGRSGAHIVRGDTTGARSDRIIGGMESELGEPYIFYVGADLLQDIDFADDEDNEYDIVETGDQDLDGIRFYDLTYHEDSTGMVLYQSEPISVTQAGRYDIDALEYRRVDYIGRLVDEVDQVLRTTDFSLEAQWPNGFKAELGNQRLPPEAKTITKFGDLIFAPIGDKLIYSDLRFADPIVWAYPKANDVRVPGSVEFASEINEVLLFGGRDGLYRFTGATEFDFRSGQISGIGPVDGHAFAKTADMLTESVGQLAFAGENGFYITDGSAVQMLSQLVLDEVFEDHKTKTGNVIFLRNNEILFSITQVDNDGDETISQYKLEDGQWIRFNLPFIQVADIVNDSETLIFIADGTERLKKLDWNSTAATDDLDWRFQTQILDFGVDRLKRFVKLEFTGDATGDITLTLNPDERDAITKTFQARESLQPVRVPINRRARRLQWSIEGAGRVKIQGLKMTAEV